MRTVFHDELAQITEDLVGMARLVSSAVTQATTALLDADIQTAEQVIDADEAIDLKRNDLDAHAIDPEAAERLWAVSARLTGVDAFATAAPAAEA